MVEEDIRTVEQRARARSSMSASGIGAAIAGRLPDAEGGLQRYRIRLSDGRIFGWVDVVLNDGALEPASVEHAVEDAALDVEGADRLLLVEAHSPIYLGAGG